MAKLVLYLQKLIDAIIQYPEGFNDYVANHLPYQQRDGKIARKEFNRIEPRFKIAVEDEKTAIKALENSICKNFERPLETMTIRSYCKYYRIAHEAYDRYFERMSYQEIMQKHSVNKKTVQRALGKTKAYLLTYSRWYLDLAGKVKESINQ